ncbi:TIGR03826 family flagellar region protein [Halobacillus mangrovi]|uniref:Flagellar protein n=1 Tax=Halobacillus mangrovi TaxID=402384 RepID=A0A1W6A0X8_9BACI|nr:TIGR03826 family flagellar region protein [Halobacillus mangrovi]ARI79140.1 hypothetical protein HM131_06575 [Halobacillus mangrovi]
MVDNCPHCNAIFMKDTTYICPSCRKIEEEQFHTVYGFLRNKRNRTATIAEVVEETGVPQNQLREFVKQKRLHPAQFPNLAYLCEKCGAEIKSGRICKDCTKEIEDGLLKHARNERSSLEEYDLLLYEEAVRMI